MEDRGSVILLSFLVDFFMYITVVSYKVKR
nr:MAG TPA: hypothetical protein [Caudoviricetes sp.]